MSRNDTAVRVISASLDLVLTSWRIRRDGDAPRLVTAYVTEKPVKETCEALRTLLIARGWEPYGKAGDERGGRERKG